jgi:hypothetical protein
MFHFTYINYGEKDKVVFECDAAGILEADKLCKNATGIIPIKSSWLGCRIEEINVKVQ